jgi:hypothetical protein
MSKKAGTLLKMLADRDGGWVNRRDAADGLGRVALSVIEGLKAHEEDSDQDVSLAIKSSLQALRHAVDGVDLSATPGGLPTLEKCLKALEIPERRDLEELENGYSMKVTIKDGRSQSVLIEETQSVQK